MGITFASFHELWNINVVRTKLITKVICGKIKFNINLTNLGGYLSEPEELDLISLRAFKTSTQEILAKLNPLKEWCEGTVLDI